MSDHDQTVIPATSEEDEDLDSSDVDSDDLEEEKKKPHSDDEEDSENKNNQLKGFLGKSKKHQRNTNRRLQKSVQKKRAVHRR